ncbi:kinase-like domain-containing protein [Mycena rosella]|uniref:Kinase-like domain-containing protein n=1 Tax=Mycena rosella TaxID=1033263 RepID=A0AAD7GVT4_MYCRO|nr:kinase-like domain-containing protein [Mycena rosella]
MMGDPFGCGRFDLSLVRSAGLLSDEEARILPRRCPLPPPCPPPSRREYAPLAAMQPVPVPQPRPPKAPTILVGVPAVHIHNNQLVVGDSQTRSTRSYTELKSLGDGSFGTVWLCDWHGTLPPNTPLSPMQCGAGAKPEWAGKRLVAVKRMRKKWEGGWDECRRLKELESLRAIPFHPNIIPLYDFFLQPDSKELYFVFEPMEGNLYHLVKARKGRPFAGGLISSIFRQMVAGLEHIHSSGYFHRDMKPENVLVTTTGLHDYASVSPTSPPNAPPEKDVVAIIKLADFGLAREIRSLPPYTEYVSTRWYRAPEVLLMSNNYSSPVDMWALGTIMAELINLRPLFPGMDTMDQLARICDVLGDPSDVYGFDSHNNPVGGGPWPRGVQMAGSNGFAFRKTQPKNVYALFPIEPHFPPVPVSLIHCIRDLLKYEPGARLTSRQCLDHPYLRETTPRNNIPLPPGLRVAASAPSPLRSAVPSSVSPSSISSRSHDVDSNGHRTFFNPPSISPHSSSPSTKASEYAHDVRMYHQPSPHASGFIQEERRSQALASSVWDGERAHASNNDYNMDVSPDSELSDEYLGGPMDIQSSPIVQEFPARPQAVEPMHDAVHVNDAVLQPQKLGNKLGSLGFVKKRSGWGLGGMFGGDKSHQNGLPPLEEMAIASTSTPSLKRSQSSSTDSRSLRELSPVREPRRMDAKKNKKEAERIQREAEKQRRALAEKMQREQARAVMQKRSQMTQNARQFEWDGGTQQRLEWDEKGKQAASGPVRQNQAAEVPATTINAAAGRFVPQPEVSLGGDWRRDTERMTKARRREFDDDHSISSSDVHSIGHMSSISFASVDSDPGPSRIRNRPSLLGMSRMMSSSSLQTSFDEFSQDFPEFESVRSSNSFSLEGQLATDFRAQASFDPGRSLGGSISPPPMQTLSLSPSLSPAASPWLHPQPDPRLPYMQQHSPLHPRTSPMNGNSFEFSGRSHSPYGHPPSPSMVPKSAINPMFKVPPLPGPPGDSLPPFSQLDAVAGEYGEYPAPPYICDRPRLVDSFFWT